MYHLFREVYQSESCTTFLLKCGAEQIMSALQGPLLMSLAHRGGPVMLLCVGQSESCSHIRVRY